MKKEANIVFRQIKEFKPEVLVVVDDNAFREVALPMAGDKDLSVVFSGMNGQPETYNAKKHFMDKRARPGSNITGVYEKLYLVRSIIVMQSAIPSLKGKKIVGITDYSSTGDGLTVQFEIELKSKPKNINWEHKRVKDWQEYTSLIKKLNDDEEIGAIYPVAQTLKVSDMDYVFGHEAADAFKKVFKKIKPEVEIVGDEYHPIGTKDFGPYVSKILATKAEVVFTSNFEADLTNLIKQARTLGMNAIIGSYYLNATPVMNSLREAAIGCVTAETYMETVETKKNQEFLETWQPWYKKHYPGEPSFYLMPGKPAGTVNGTYFLAEAIKKAGSIEADKVIRAWEGMSFDGLCGKVTMRACDHQIQTPAFVARIEADHPFRKIIDFPYIGKPTMIPVEKISVPPGETGNSRCK